MTQFELEEALEDGAKRLLAQLEVSNAFSTLGDSTIAEASLVIQIATSFIQKDCAVWAESPFEPETSKENEHEARDSNHLDLVVDLSTRERSAPSLLLVEAKAAGAGRSTMLRAVIKDIKRLRDWATLNILSRPLFFYWSNVANTQGVVAFVFTEQLIQQDNTTFVLRPDSLASWWESFAGVPQAAEGVIVELQAELQNAKWRKVFAGNSKDGGVETFVAFALFDCQPTTLSDLRKTAAHEAAHAVVALAQGIPVHSISLGNDADYKGKTHIDWKAERGEIPDNELLVAAAAIAYAGAFVDYRFRAPHEHFETIVNRLPTDVGRLQEVRDTAVAWNCATDTVDASEKFVVPGYQKAEEMVVERWAAIIDLAESIEEVSELDRDWLENWFGAYSSSEESDLE